MVSSYSAGVLSERPTAPCSVTLLWELWLLMFGDAPGLLGVTLFCANG
jgi:hypothetical protein